MDAELKAALDEAHVALTSIAERSAWQDARQIARVVMRIIEAMRGDEKKTEIPQRHHP